MHQYVSEIEQTEFKSIVKRGAKKKVVPENEPISEPKTGLPKQTDLFS